MVSPLPEDVTGCLDWSWSDYDPYVNELIDMPLSETTLDEWLTRWSSLTEVVGEVYQRLYVAHTVDTADQDSDRRYQDFVSKVLPQALQTEQNLKEKLLSSSLVPDGFEIPLRNIRAEVDLFREANLPLLSEGLVLSAEYEKIIGAQTIEWEGQEMTPAQMRPVYLDSNRDRREKAWRLSFSRQLADREAIYQNWKQNLALRVRITQNSGKTDYREYRWQELLRFDYTPEDCLEFHRAIEQVVVPAASRIYEKRRQRLGVESLRPWDLEVDPFNRPPLKPYRETGELVDRCQAIFEQVDPELGDYFRRMVKENLLDLENRLNKAPGGYCTYFPRSRVPFIFSNAVGLHDDVQTLLHEGGHAFHAFESSRLKYFQQMNVPTEFSEVASMGMELLAAPYLLASQGGFYSPAEAARARIEHLEGNILFWPYMAVVDAFQHWAYTHLDQAADPANCDLCWAGLWQRFMPGVDWSGLEDEMRTGWLRKLHIHEYPFYYVEYGMAELGAVQVWSNAQQDEASAVEAYRRALSLGGTRTLPQLFEAAGIRLAFDVETLRSSVDLIESVILDLEGQSIA